MLLLINMLIEKLQPRSKNPPTFLPKCMATRKTERAGTCMRAYVSPLLVNLLRNNGLDPTVWDKTWRRGGQTHSSFLFVGLQSLGSQGKRWRKASPSRQHVSLEKPTHVSGTSTASSSILLAPAWLWIQLMVKRRVQVVWAGLGVPPAAGMRFWKWSPTRGQWKPRFAPGNSESVNNCPCMFQRIVTSVCSR